MGAIRMIPPPLNAMVFLRLDSIAATFLELITHVKKAIIEPAEIVDIIIIDTTFQRSVSAPYAPTIIQIVTQF